MAGPRRTDPELVARARAALAQATTVEELRAAQAIALPALVHTTLEQTGTLLGVSRTTVHRLQWQFRRRLGSGRPLHAGWGGRRRALMTLEGEKAFLAPWIEQARRAGMPSVSPLRAALSDKLGREIAASVFYRLLARHGWRRVTSATRYRTSRRRRRRWVIA